MEKELKLPELGEGVDEADVLKVLVSKGDVIAKDQPLLEIETDKATVEVPASESGTVTDVKVSAGDRIRVGQVLVTISGNHEPAAASRPVESAERTEGPKKAETPETAEAAEKRVQRAEPEPAKQEMKREEPKPLEPTVAPEAMEPESAAETATVAEPPLAEPAAREAPDAKRLPAHEATPVPASPSVRRLARELGVDVTRVEGHGPDGRIRTADVMEHARAIVQSASGVASRPSLPSFEAWGAVRRERLSGLRRAAAARLGTAWTSVPHVTHHDLADVTETEKTREKYAARVEAEGGKLTFTAIAVYIVAAALERFPRFNASIDVAREEVVYKDYCHVGIATDTERGLLVPVLRDADRKSLLEIAIELPKLAERARSGKLAREDMEGSSFTVTNLGGIGGIAFSPIVNWPDAAILGISRARLSPVWRDGAFEPRLMLPLSLSYDHRLIDGADAARFVRFLTEAFEHPLALSLASPDRT